MPGLQQVCSPNLHSMSKALIMYISRKPPQASEAGKKQQKQMQILSGVISSPDPT